MSALFGFIFFSIILAGLILFFILWTNSRKDKKVSNSLKEELDIYKTLGLRQGKSFETSTKEYMETLKGGLIENDGGRRNQSNEGRTNESNPINQPTTRSNPETNQTNQYEERRSIQTEPVRDIRRIESKPIESDGKLRKSVEINWE